MSWRAITELTTQLGYDASCDDVGVRLERILSRDNERFFVAGADGRVIGRALLNHAEAWAREQGCSLVRLSSSVTRTKAHRFYEELGYINLKTQYSFAKPLDADAAARLGSLVPRVD